MRYFPIRSIYRPNFISSESGFTLTEVVVAMLMSAAIVLGLMAALELSLRSFQSAEARVRLQRDGSYVLEEFSRALQAAKEEIEGDGGNFSVVVPGANFQGDSTVVLSVRDGKLFSDGRQVVPAPWEDNRVSVTSVNLQFIPALAAFALQILMTYTPGGNAPMEQRLFETQILSRNLLLKSNT